MCEYILNTELKNINVQPLKSSWQKALSANMAAKEILKLYCVNYFIVFLICSDIKLSSTNICGPYESWDKILYPDICFVGLSTAGIVIVVLLYDA